MIPFQGDVTSVGIVINAQTHKKEDLSESFIRETFESHSLLKKRVEGAEALFPARVTSNYSEFCGELIAPKWLLIGDAASFLDPVFSRGVHVAFQSADFAHDVILEAIDTNSPLNETPKGLEYAKNVNKGVNRFRSLLRLFYNTDFVDSMIKTKKRPNTLQAFISAVGGEMWNDENPLFVNGVL